MDRTESYVVRIYRRDGASVAGVVESVASGEQRGFHDATTLWRVLVEDRPPGHALLDDPLGENT